MEILDKMARLGEYSRLSVRCFHLDMGVKERPDRAVAKLLDSREGHHGSFFRESPRVHDRFL
jgi:hypothetical protein